MQVFVNMSPGCRQPNLLETLRHHRHEIIDDPKRADVCLHSCEWPSNDDLDWIVQWTDRWPQAPVVVMLRLLQLEAIRAAARYGAFSFVREDDTDEVIISALASAAQAGRRRVPPLAPVIRAFDGPDSQISRLSVSTGEDASLGPLRPAVSVVIPAKNECQNLLWVLAGMPDIVDEIVLVDGRSTDGSVEVACQIRPDIVIVEDRQEGKGAALRAGFERARGEIIVMMDADGSMSPSEIRRMVYLIDEGFDFVKGSRFMAGGHSDDITRLRRLGNGFFVGLVNAFWGVNYTDLCYGFCALRRSALPALGLRSNGFEIETELNIRAIKAGLRTTETPSSESHRKFGNSHLRTFRDGSRVLRKILVELFSTQLGPPSEEGIDERLQPLVNGLDVA